ncbi:lantibiotic dehydratase family protein [Streptomyces atratus]|uniref:lantibiotic dehydratase family protein n=1 Tax=Streptomyces atratus TaxID=1893 RepID=UPI0021A2C741|nr:lantibiotic dehydratase family protein [Streptomyces atratus]MCT2549159.1 lantibiotic dehydratase family protein [Streptomyces atratus]
MTGLHTASPAPARPGPAGDRLLGATALVRASGVPVSMWTAAGGSGLFGRVVEHADAVERQTVRARRLAEALSGVVPDRRLTDTERRAVLALRRRLHSGSAPGPADCRFLETATAVPERLVREAGALCRAAASALATRVELERALGDERERVGALAWSLVSASPVLREFVDGASPGLAQDVAARLAEGESWSGKRLRKRSAYLWRALGRAAAKTTPRGWAGQVAPVPVGGCGFADGTRSGFPEAVTGSGFRLLAPGTELAGLAATAVENVHAVRTLAGARDLRGADPATALAPAPLYLTDAGDEGGAGGMLRCYAIDPGDPGRLRQVAVRRTALLDLLLTLFAEGPRTLAELECALPVADPVVLRGFLTHLTGLGVLQLCVAPRRRHIDWSPAARAAGSGRLPRPTARAGDPGPGDWFLDSYRGLDARVPEQAAARVQRALRTAHRLAALRRADRDTGSGAPAPTPGTEQVDEHPRPVGEILAALLSSGERPSPAPAPRRYGGWHPARGPDSGYARLLDRLAAHRDAARVDIDDDLLDELGAPPAEAAVPPWPMDCLLRPLPGPGPVAVLETASPAGIIDARFAEALQDLYGGYGAVDVYRDFLAAVERRTGVRFVELLVPPVTDHAANTVRRPVITRWWTGDPNPAAYFGPGGPEQRYLPLDRITLRRSGHRIVAEADGERVVPVYHATRNPMPPYDRLVRLLLSAGHPWAGNVLSLDGLAAAFPACGDVIRLPRLTAGTDLVVSPATWRVPRARLWRREEGDLDRVRALASLRRTAAMPRFVFVRPAFEAKPVPADLEALTALNVIDRTCAALPGDELIFEEMLPGPQELVLRDALHRGEPVAAGLLLRLPFDRAPEELAVSAAALIHDVPGPPAPGAAAAGATGTKQVTPRKQEEIPCPSSNSPSSTP